MIVLDSYMGFDEGRYCPVCGSWVFPADRALPCQCGQAGVVAKWTTQGYSVAVKAKAGANQD